MTQPVINTMTDAIFNTDEIITVSDEMVEDLVRRAHDAPRGRFRICLHRSHDDSIQEMVIACARGVYLRPHRSRSGGDKSYHVIYGEMAFFLFDDGGHVERRIDLSTTRSGRPFHIRYRASIWHMPVVLTETVVYVEVGPGPFHEGVDPEYAPWSPAEDDHQSAGYLEELSRWCGEGP